MSSLRHIKALFILTRKKKKISLSFNFLHQKSFFLSLNKYFTKIYRRPPNNNVDIMLNSHNTKYVYLEAHYLVFFTYYTLYGVNVCIQHTKKKNHTMRIINMRFIKMISSYVREPSNMTLKIFREFFFSLLLRVNILFGYVFNVARFLDSIFFSF